MRMRDGQVGSVADLEVLKRLLTAERLSSYDSDHGEDVGDVLYLHESNMLAGAAIMHTMAMVEVLVRNALDSALVQWQAQQEHAEDWLQSRLLDH